MITPFKVKPVNMSCLQVTHIKASFDNPSVSFAVRINKENLLAPILSWTQSFI